MMKSVATEMEVKTYLCIIVGDMTKNAKDWGGQFMMKDLDVLILGIRYE